MSSELRRIVEFWTQQCQRDAQWLHPEDEGVLRARRHPFTLNYPVVPFIGDILRAPVVVLGANAGYGDETPVPFKGEHAVPQCLQHIASGSTIAWAAKVPYYVTTNYGLRLQAGRVAVINACAYRSLDAPPPGLIEDLPSARVTRTWLLNALLPLVRAEQRLVIAWRPYLWACEENLLALDGHGVVYIPKDKRRSKHLLREALEEADRFCGVSRDSSRPRSRRPMRAPLRDW